MSDKKVKTRIQNKHDLECNWIKATGFCPMEGELIIYDIEVDGSDNVLAGALEGTGRTEPYKHVRYKIGDGIHYVNDLPFVSEGAAKKTTSTGKYSHAEGAETIAQGNQAHAEGNKTEAKGDQAHAEGFETKATAAAAHAEGLGTLAANDGAHAQGKFTKAIGDASAANGYWTEANDPHQFVVGRVNENNASNLFEVGGGAVYQKTPGVADDKDPSKFDRFNVFEVSDEGQARAESFSTKSAIVNRDAWSNVGETPTRKTVLPGAIASGIQSVAIGGQRIDKRGAPTNEIELEEAQEKAREEGKTEDEIKKISIEPCTQALGNQSFAAGGGVIVEGEWSAGFGKEARTYQRAAFASGGGTRAGCTKEEYDKYAAVQRDDTAAYDVSYSLSTAEGELTKALGRTSHAEGRYGLTTGMASHVEGNESVAVGKYSHAEGWQTKTGTFTGNNKTGEIVIETSGTAAHTEGRGTTANADYAHAEGTNTYASNIASHAEGNGSIASGQYSHAEGSSTASNECAHAEGKGTAASGIASHTEGEGTIATHANAHAEGYSTDAINTNAHAEGKNSIASGASSHAEGDSTKATGAQSHAEGSQTTAINANSHAEGLKTAAFGISSHAEGYSSKIDNAYLDKLTTTTLSSQVSKDWESSTDKYLLAFGQGSHAEGLNCLAAGKYAHAEGDKTQANGQASHSGGQSSKATSNYSFTHGLGTITAAEAQAVFGKYNATDKDALFIVGNGTASSKKNAFTVKTDGTTECVDLTVKNSLVVNDSFTATKENYYAIGDEFGVEVIEDWKTSFTVEQEGLKLDHHDYFASDSTTTYGSHSITLADDNKGTNTFYFPETSGTLALTDDIVQSDWDETSSWSKAYIKNKPTKLSQFDNDTGFITESGGSITGSLEVEDIFKNGNTYHNVLEIASTKYVDEIVIKTKIPYLNSNSMPLIHIKGYAYGTQSPVDFNIAFYIWEDKITSSGVTFVGHGWKPEIYLSSYTENDTKYIALSLTGIIYYPRLTVDFTDIWGNTTKRNYSTGWSYQTREQDKTGEAETLVPQTDLEAVPYKTLATNISGNATSADYVNKAITVKLDSGNTEGTNQFTFNGSSETAINITPEKIGAIRPSEVDNKIRTAISSVLKYKGTKSTTTQLPTSGNATGDVWNITTACAASGTLPKVNAGDNVAWNGSAWDVLAGTVDLSNYSTKGHTHTKSDITDFAHNHDDRYYTETEIDAKLEGKANTSHSHTISAGAEDDDVVILVGTDGTNGVSYKATHADSGVTAGTYKSVTVDAKGHVTAGSNPTTIAGYGITDAFTKTETNNLVTAAKGYADSQDDAKAVFVKGIGENSVQKKFGASIADDDDILTTISSNLISTTPLALGESALSLGSSYSIICGSTLGPSLKVSSINGNILTCTINSVAKTLLEKLLEKFSISVTGKKIGFYLKIDNAYYLVYSEQITTTGNFITGYKINFTADETISEETLDSLVNKSASQLIACVAGGTESFTVNSGSATGKRAFAANIMTQASGEGACAFGGTSISGGMYSAAFGSSVVYGGKALGGGNSTILANAQGSIGVGEQVTTDGPQSAIFGFKNTIGANANQATVIGALNNSDYKRTFIGGHGNTAKADDQVILGAFAEASANDYFVLGCGSSTDNPKNAFKVTSDGTYGIGTTYDTSGTDCTCTKLATEAWVTNEALGVIGYKHSFASGAVGSVMLYNYRNDGSDGFQIATASGSNAVSLGKGTRATADMAFAANNQTTASHGASAAFGYKTSTTNNAQLVCGSGEGGSTPDAHFRVACNNKDGLAVLKNGNVNIGGNANIKGDLTVDNNISASGTLVTGTATFNERASANNGLDVKGSLIQTAGSIVTTGGVTANGNIHTKNNLIAGSSNTVNGNQNAVIGWGNTATANCKQSLIAGASNEGAHQYTFICGQGNKTAANYQAVLGRYANVNADMYLAVGNGESTSKPGNAFYVTNTGTYGIGQDAAGTTSCTKLATEAWVLDRVGAAGQFTQEEVDKIRRFINSIDC